MLEISSESIFCILLGIGVGGIISDYINGKPIRGTMSGRVIGLTAVYLFLLLIKLIGD